MRSFKKSQIDKLGEKLRHQALPAADDLELLQRIKADYEPAIAQTQAILRARLGLESSSRPKTVNTIIEKLKAREDAPERHAGHRWRPGGLAYDASRAECRC
jgi:hypothetical protein